MTIDLGDALRFLQDVVDGRAEVVRRDFGRNDRLVRFRRLAHFRRPGRAAIAPDIDQIDVISARRDQIHHRDAFDRQVEGGLGRIGCAMHEQQDLVRGISGRRDACCAQQLDPRIARRDHGVGRSSLGSFACTAREVLRQTRQGNPQKPVGHRSPPGRFCLGHVAAGAWVRSACRPNAGSVKVCGFDASGRQMPRGGERPRAHRRAFRGRAA